MLKSPLLTHSTSNTEESKLELNYPREIGYGLPSGYYQDITNMENGQQVDKLISWKAEVMLTIQKSLEEEFNLSDQHSIGVQTGNTTSSPKPMLRNHYQVEHSTTISISLVLFGITKLSTPILITKQTKFSKLIILIQAIGRSRDYQEETILGRLQATNVLLLIKISI